MIQASELGRAQQILDELRYFEDMLDRLTTRMGHIVSISLIDSGTKNSVELDTGEAMDILKSRIQDRRVRLRDMGITP